MAASVDGVVTRDGRGSRKSSISRRMSDYRSSVSPTPGDGRPATSSIDGDEAAASPSIPTGPGRGWLRLDTTKEEAAKHAEMTDEASFAAFPTPPSGNGLGGINVYRSGLGSARSSGVGLAKTHNAAVHDRYVTGTPVTDASGAIDRDREVDRLANGRSRDEANTGKSLERRAAGMADFFGPEIFQIVLRNPTTAHRFLQFCQNRACGENMEFLEKINRYNRLLDDVAKLLGEIHTTHTSPDATRAINISGAQTKRITSDIKAATQSTIPAMEQIFIDAQDDIEKLISTDIYPRFVKHQVTISATLALMNDKLQYQGLGDCFCLTDPSIADNPIVFASDGFVDVTGYSRKDIIPRNCRFLQGTVTDRQVTRRLRKSIDNAEETVELLLNYRKNGEPFWNLLYVAPLFDQHGTISFFLGGQIDCSTTIHSKNDIMKVLSLPDDDYRPRNSLGDATRSFKSGGSSIRSKSSNPFFQSFRKMSPEEVARRANVRPEAGMEHELLEKIGKQTFKSQVEAFYTAYSKYLVMKYSATTNTFIITHYSPTAIDLLCLNRPDGSVASICGKDIFKVFAEYSIAPDTKQHKAVKLTVRETIRRGVAVSCDMGLLTGVEAAGRGFMGNKKSMKVRAEEKFVGHWTPLKDKEGRVRYVVLTIAPRTN